MSESGSPDQQSLGVFESDETDKTDKASTTSESGPSSSSPGTVKKSPLTELYETLSDAAQEQFPEAAQDLSISRAIEPETRRHTTTDIPEEVPALPFKIGQWELAVSEPDRVIYATSGDAYDYRWGDGGGLYGMEVYLNNRGANKDGKFHRRVSTVVGFENGDKIKQRSVDEKSDLVSVRGHNVGENDGDFGYSSGTKVRAETGREAIIELLIYLHHHPGPFGRCVETSPSTAWSLQKLSPRCAIFQTDAPPSIGDDTLTLSVADYGIKIKSNNDDQPAHMTTYYGLPALESVPDSLLEQQGKTHEFRTPAATITAANRLLSKPPAHSVTAGSIE